MNSQEMKKKEKGKEIVSFEENPSTSLSHLDHFDHTKEGVSMLLSEQEIATLLETNKKTYEESLEKSKKDNAEVGTEEGKSLSPNITPCIFYTSDEKARLRWSRDLHDCFVNAVTKLGGPKKATPKSVKEIMEVEGIALHHVKSHLQKFRLGQCNIRDRTNQYTRRFKTARDVRKKCASLDSPQPQVDIKPKVIRAVKPKPKKEKIVQGSLYMLIEELRLQRCRETQRMQIALAMENQRTMLETQYLEASMTNSVSSQHNNFILPSTTLSPHSSSHQQKQWITPLSYNISEGQTNPFSVHYPQQSSIIIPQATTFVKDFTQNTSNTSYDPSIYPTEDNLQFNDNHNENMAQYFINPYMSIEPQPMSGITTITTPQQLQLNDDCVIQDSHCNAPILSTTVPPAIDSFHQDTLNNTILVSRTPQPIPSSLPHHTYSSYPPYNTLEVVQAQLSTLQNSSTSRTQETPSRETNLSATVTRDEENLVDKYIDWAKVEEVDIDELDPVEILEKLGFGVNP